MRTDVIQKVTVLASLCTDSSGRASTNIKYSEDSRIDSKTLPSQPAFRYLGYLGSSIRRRKRGDVATVGEITRATRPVSGGRERGFDGWVRSSRREVTIQQVDSLLNDERGKDESCKKQRQKREPE